MRKRRNSIRFIISASFIILMVVTFSIISYFVFSNWKESADDMVSQMERETSEEILNKIEAFISLPLYINEVNHNFLENKIVNLENKGEREVYFASVIRANQEEIYSFAYGNEKGEYYGARRNKDNNIEVLENNEETNGKSRYYSINEELIAEKLVEETGVFDPRTREWYKKAKESGKPVFSSVYKHFVVNDLAISAACPIYNKNGSLRGVLGTHLILSKINTYLNEIVSDKSAVAYIIEKDTGNIIANSLKQPNFRVEDGNKVKRINIKEVNNQGIVKAYNNYRDGSKHNHIDKVKDDKLHITLTDYKKEGLDWIIITAIPEKQFMGSIIKSIRVSIIISIIGLVIAILIYTIATKIFLKPIYSLIKNTERFSKGDFSQRVGVTREDEIGQLSLAFNNMAEQLDNLVNNLEGEVKERTKELIYVSYHDQLTGVYNRRYFEEALINLDKEENLPFTIVMADMNGLKLVNDSLGHSLGDELLKKTAEVITKGAKEDHIVARLGGDEFVILMPSTSDKEAQKVINFIRDIASKEKVATVDISISFGYGTKNIKEEKIADLLKKAEDYMYKVKLFESPSMRGKTISAIIKTLHEKNKREEAHCRRVSELCKLMGEALNLSKDDTEELKTLGLLHDIGKIAIEEGILNKPGKLTNEEWEQLKRHPEIGYRILSTVNDMTEMAKYTLAHHERWDGKGYPKGLKETQIPLQARIISIADAYDAMTSDRSYRSALPQEVAIEELKKNAGMQFDPELVKVFIEKVINN